MKLFMFYVGGDCGASNIELHDVRFSVGDTAEDCYADLRKQWWGDAKTLHLDCWGAVDQADGFDVAVTTSPPPEQADKLFFLNLGGYDASEFGELHRNVLLVASDVKSAITRGLKDVRGWSLPHRDRIYEVEKAINLTALFRGRGLYLSLSRAVEQKPFNFTCKYVRLG
jgi:hypothetical protein